MSKEKRKSAIERAKEYLSQYDIEEMIEAGRKIDRTFVVHVGPTNSGKTYHALQALRKAESGVYLGPLRLLALEVFDALNTDEIACNLLTGEEKEEIFGARITAATIEMCDLYKQYDVAVIDEAQLIADRARGGNWTKALLMLNAREIHVCVAPEGLNIICQLIENLGAELSVVEHKRLTPLLFGGLMKGVKDVEPGDALITFSRKGVLNIAAELERAGYKASVIYGALPPASRREEVRRFTNGETSVVVATDAIGLGVSLPIRRIVFCTTTKFDGTQVRNLNNAEIKQIAGRAGRFGKYNKGYVMTFENETLIKTALEREVNQIDKIVIPFPEQAIHSEFDLNRLFCAWNQLPRVPGFRKVDMTEPGYLYEMLPAIPYGVSKSEVYSYVCCPVDIKNEQLVWYWRSCCQAVFKREPLPIPYFSADTLEGCELQYRAFDIYHQMSRRIGKENDCSKEKELLSEKINKFLKDSKLSFLKKCSSCGKPLPLNYSYGICQKCYRKRVTFDWDF